MKTKLELQFNEGMPREVAIAILTEPKAKISNAFRKTCHRALETHFIALPPKQPADPLRKLHGATLAQLLKWSKRCIARRTVAQRAFIKLDTNDWPKGMTAAKAKRIQAALSFQVASLDAQYDAIQDEKLIRAKTIKALDNARAFGVFDLSRSEQEQIRLDTQRGL